MFDLYRLNLVDIEDLFTTSRASRVCTDSQIVEVLRTASSPDFDENQETRTAQFKWSIREFSEYKLPGEARHLCSVMLARSVVSKDGLIVTDDGIASGTSASYPPLASMMSVFFDLTRHLVAVEHTGELSITAWRDHVERILQNAAVHLGWATSLTLEPVPESNGIVGLFRSFELLTRLKVTLRIPNPELTRYTRAIYEELVESDVREYTQDMKNRAGISKSESARPFATAVLAEQGYRKGEVQFEGVRDGVFETVLSGSIAARGTINTMRDYVRGIQANAKTKEAKNILVSIISEIDKLHPREMDDGK